MGSPWAFVLAVLRLVWGCFNPVSTIFGRILQGFPGPCSSAESRVHCIATKRFCLRLKIGVNGTGPRVASIPWLPRPRKPTISDPTPTAPRGFVLLHPFWAGRALPIWALHPGVIGRDPMLRRGIVRRFVNDRIVQLGRQMCSKTAQDARQFFVQRFLATLGFHMHLSGCALDPFRTLKVQ